jgi:hypothetical protein
MPITLVTGPANAGKAGVVMDALYAHHARGERPLLVVPTRADVERYRLELAQRQPTLQEGVERFEGLLAEVLRRAGDTERPLTRLARERALTAVLRHAAAGRPTAAAGRPTAAVERPTAGAGRPNSGAGRPTAAAERPTAGVVRALATLIGELEIERVTPARLREALDTWAAADPAYAHHALTLGELFEQYSRALERLRPARVTPERQAARALDALRRAPALWGSTPVLLYGFDDFTRLQLDAIETLGAVVGAPVTVSLTYEPGRIAFAARGDTFQRLLPLAAEHLRLAPRAELADARVALHHLERHLFEPEAPAPVQAGDALRLLEGGGERAELELVADEIHRLLERGVHPGEIAVAHRSPATIAELLEEVFQAHHIPFALRRALSFASTATGRALLGLLKATFSAEEDGGLGDLLAWLRAPGLLRQPELADALEWRARHAGVSSAAGARALWESEHWPLEPLDRLREAAERGPAALFERTAAELERLGYAPPEPSGPDAVGSPPSDEPQDPRAPADGDAHRRETRALAVAGAALRELHELARSAPALAPDAHELIALLRDLELIVGEEPEPGSTDPRVAPAPDGAPPRVPAAVAVLDPLALRARRVRALFLCGLQEGVFPAPARPEPYLSEDERRALSEVSGLRLGRPVDALAAERHLLYAAVSRPWELLVLSWHTADDDGLPTPRSLFVDDICDLFTEDLHETRARRALGEVSPLAPTGAPQGEIAPLRDPLVLAQLREQRLWSASGLQAWAACPVRWFVERMLSAGDLEPEAEPLARGALAHAALRDTFERLREDTGSARLTAERLPRARELLHIALAEHADERPLSTAPERVPGVRRRLEADLERYLEYAAECGERARDRPQRDSSESGQPTQPGPTELEPTKPGPTEPGPTKPELTEPGPTQPGPTQLEPTRLELAFGFPNEPEGLPALDIGEGIMVRGYVDRVDTAPGGEAVVYDYKSAHAAPPDRWLEERNFQIALYMRAVEQLPHTRVVGGFYQPLSGRDLRARGVLAEGEGVELECVRGDARPGAQIRELLEDVLAAARVAAAQARAGELRARPDTCGFGGSGCMYPSICRCDR